MSSFANLEDMNFSFFLFFLYHINSSKYLWRTLAPIQMVPLKELEKFTTHRRHLIITYWQIVIIEKSTCSTKVNSGHRFMCLQNPHHVLQALCGLDSVVKSQSCHLCLTFWRALSLFICLGRPKELILTFHCFVFHQCCTFWH